MLARIIRRPRPKTAILAALCTLVTLGVAGHSFGQGSGGAGKAPITIGVLMALTGTYAALGTAEYEAIKLYADTVNTKGGINGHKVELVVADTASDESKAVNQFRSLVVRDNVVAVLGPSSTGEAIAVKPVSLALKTPTIAPASSMAIITPTSQAKYMFKEFPSTEDSLKAQLQYAKDKGLKKIAIIAANNAYGQEPVRELPRLVGQYGLQLVGSATFPPTATDVTSELSSLAGAKPDVTLVWAVNPANAIVAKNAKAISFPGLLFNSPGGGTPQYITVGGTAAEGTLVQGSKVGVPDRLSQADPQYEELQNLLKVWKAAGHADNPNQFASNGWDCFVILERALRTAKVTPGETQQTRDRIRDALETAVKDVAGINAIYSFSPENHGPSGIRGLAVLVVKDGRFDLLASY